MPPLTIDIPLAVLNVGTHNYGPASVADDVSQGTITIDRTVSRPAADGLNGQPSTTKMEIALWQSNDAGATWELRASAGLIGGLYPSNQAGDPYLFSNVSVELLPGTGRRVRADVTVAGDRVAVGGTIAIV